MIGEIEIKKRIQMTKDSLVGVDDFLKRANNGEFGESTETKNTIGLFLLRKLELSQKLDSEEWLLKTLNDLRKIRRCP